MTVEERIGEAVGAIARRIDRREIGRIIRESITAAIEEERGIWNEVERQRFDVTYHHGDSVWHAVNYGDFTVGAGASPREAVEALLAKLATTA